MICAFLRTFFRLIGSGRFRSKSLSEIDQILVMKKNCNGVSRVIGPFLFCVKNGLQTKHFTVPMSSSDFHSRRRCAMCTTISNFVPRQYLLQSFNQSRQKEVTQIKTQYELIAHFQFPMDKKQHWFDSGSLHTPRALFMW